MEDLHAKLEKILIDAEDCALISQLSCDPAKRATFARLAVQLRGLAREVEAAIKTQTDQPAYRVRGRWSLDQDQEHD